SRLTPVPSSSYMLPLTSRARARLTGITGAVAPSPAGMTFSRAELATDSPRTAMLFRCNMRSRWILAGMTCLVKRIRGGVGEWVVRYSLLGAKSCSGLQKWRKRPQPQQPRSPSEPVADLVDHLSPRLAEH